MNRAATAFAPGKRSGGRTLTWEALQGVATPALLSATFATLIRTVGTIETRILTLIPANVTRGVVTMERVRGLIEVYFESPAVAAFLLRWPVWLSVQLVPLRSGNITEEAVLNTRNSADQESNRIIWQRQYYPNSGTTITAPGPVEMHTSNHLGEALDIKVKRRFARDTWALIMVCEADTVAQDRHLITIQMRGLFLATDSI